MHPTFCVHTVSRYSQTVYTSIADARTDMPPIDPARFLPLKNDAFHVLMALTARERHGYGIIRDVEAWSEGEVMLQAGALYRLLKRLAADGLIEEVAEKGQPADPEDPRRYYRATRLGLAVLDAEVARLRELLRRAKLARAGARPKLA